MARENRSVARLNAVQALYQMEMGGQGLNEILEAYSQDGLARQIDEHVLHQPDVTLMRTILEQALARQTEIDRKVDAILIEGWPLHRVESVLRAVLRAGGAEMLACPTVPIRVIITEYVDIASAFLAREETGMVNAILDAMAHHWRAGDMAAPRTASSA
jgi:N utilization substance protein B